MLLLSQLSMLPYMLYPQGTGFLIASMILSILHRKIPRIVRATEQYENPVKKLKFSYKWIEGKDTINDQEKESTSSDSKDVEQEEVPQKCQLS
ncbi:hypothetical protein PVK06_030253 [Gossypium arboreum]|uniref:Uncharacterized protein n=1 Tax=Gossypium arboreum TaxID=29729 RepID=A0ABR0NQX0_GOSAR|nr:hypothetical protein PVK06_030253 [Gossypium arboreum]